MPTIAITLAVLATIALSYQLLTARTRRHKAWRDQPFPAEWEELLRENVRHYALLPEPLSKELQGHIQVFLAEKHFEGCGGLEVTEKMRVTVASLACMLLLNRQTSHYKKVKTVLLYPKAYKAETALGADGISQQEPQGRLGESWDHGTVVLSWNSVKNSASNIKNGHNLVLHEFAHQLDQETGAGDGVPALDDESQYSSWAEVLAPEYERLKRRAAKGKNTLMDHYGATNPAEFFAVATETFFEKAEKLKEKRPELYQELTEYYQVDPAQWHAQLRQQEQGDPPAQPAVEEDQDKGFVMPAWSPFAS